MQGRRQRTGQSKSNGKGATLCKPWSNLQKKLETSSLLNMGDN
jgi:hypothetical protein